MNETTNERANRALIITAALVAFVSFVALLATAESLPPTWDEGDALYRAEQVGAWFDAFVRSPQRLRNDPRLANPDPIQRGLVARKFFADAPDRRALLTPEAIAVGFPHTIYREGHPAGYSELIILGRSVSSLLHLPISEKAAFRAGPIFLFSIALGAIFIRVARSFGVLCGLTTVVAVATCPRLFAHAQIAGGDSILISSWLIAWATFDYARKSTVGAAVWGAAVGTSFCAKFSGFLVVAPFALVEIVEETTRRVRNRRKDRSERTSRVFARGLFGLAVALTLFFIANPPLWNAPIEGAREFWRLNTTREGFDIPVCLFGRLYSPSNPPPWWNGFFQLGATIPLLTLLCAFVSLFAPRAAANSARFPFERALRTALALGLTLPITRVFPGLPVHDGARLLIASASFWGILGALGARALFERLLARANAIERPRLRGLARVAARVLFATPFVVGAVDLVGSAPQYLSFYNATIGGVVGATRKGLETTYYWDAFDAKVAEALKRETRRAREEGRPSGALFGAFSNQTLDFYRRWNILGETELGTISEPSALDDVERYGFYVVQRRPSGLTALDAAMISRARPVLVKRVFNPIAFRRDAGVVALEIYDARTLTEVLRPESERTEDKKTDVDK